MSAINITECGVINSVWYKETSVPHFALQYLRHGAHVASLPRRKRDPMTLQQKAPCRCRRPRRSTRDR